jgi:hypothetical protein
LSQKASRQRRRNCMKTGRRKWRPALFLKVWV